MTSVVVSGYIDGGIGRTIAKEAKNLFKIGDEFQVKKMIMPNNEEWALTRNGSRYLARKSLRGYFINYGKLIIVFKEVQDVK